MFGHSVAAMDNTPSLANTTSNTSTNKRRRFVASSTPSFTPYCDSTAIEHRDFDTPFQLQLNGQTPTQSDIEAELFRVGMRVRKSVNDGYKTKALTSPSYFDMGQVFVERSAAINTASFSSFHSTQIEEPGMWDYSTNSKRGYECDSDSDDQDFMPRTPTLGGYQESMEIPVDYFSIDFDGMSDVGVSPFTVTDENRPPRTNGRRLAIPKSRKQLAAVLQPQDACHQFARSQAPFQLNGTRWMGHKRMTSCSAQAKMSLNDFGDASFLQRREDVDMDCS